MRTPLSRATRISFLALFAVCLLALANSGLTAPAQQNATVRTYYVAADEVDWNYLPSGTDGMMGMKADGYEKLYTRRGHGYIGSVYRKAIYREYTDATFRHLMPRPPRQQYLGLVGPIIHAEVGDTIKIVFRNHGTHPYSIHPHGVLYMAAMEGAPHGRMPMHGADGNSVAPGKTFTYLWQVPERAGPGPNDPSSIVWPYHSHVDERRDDNSGLIGAIIVTRHGSARPDGTPSDVDREFVTYFVYFDENHSWFLKDNIRRFAGKPDPKKLYATAPFDSSGDFDPFMGSGMPAANFKSNMNGYQYATMPMPAMHRGEHVRWYVLTIGEGLNFHTPHWHGNSVVSNGNRVDVLNIGPAQSLTADMVPDNLGSWLYHCHVSDHMEAGMVARYQVLP
jgi:FtsP/CotA-like multicopper oxidase with cupredoxin domain